MPDDEWAGDRVTRWLELAPQLERQLAPVSDLLFAAAAIVPGEHVLDIGCGTGPTTRQAAELTGATGRVTGLDISGDMLAAAAASLDQTSSAGAGARAAPDWLEADAVSWSPVPGTYDLAMSRFGVMFFTDPSTAVANIAASVRVGGRLAVAVWGERPESPLFEIPYRIACDVLAARGQRVHAVPTDNGPFSWHDPAYVTELLTGAGFRDITVAAHTVALRFGGGVSPEVAAVEAGGFGPTRLVLADADADTLAAAQGAFAVEFAEHLDAAGHVLLEAAVRIITAAR